MVVLLLTMKIIIKITFFFLLFATISIHAQQKKWTLEECVKYALQNNIQIQKSKISKEQSGIDLKLAKAQLFPNLCVLVAIDL